MRYATRSLVTALGLAVAYQDAAPVFAQGTYCRWRDTTVGAAADACLLSSDPFSNYGALDRL